MKVLIIHTNGATHKGAGQCQWKTMTSASRSGTSSQSLEASVEPSSTRRAALPNSPPTLNESSTKSGQTGAEDAQCQKMMKTTTKCPPSKGFLGWRMLTGKYAEDLVERWLSEWEEDDVE